jgi:hypothetical protein
MSSFATPRPYDLPESAQEEVDRTPWFDFAAVLLFLAGMFNAIDGIAAVSDSKYVVNTVLFSNLHAWGWFFLIWGVVQMIAAFAVYRGAGWAIVLAITTAFFNAVAQLSAARTYPIWSITILVIDVLVIYGLIVHSGRRRRAA